MTEPLVPPLDPDAVQWSGPADAPLIVLLHGYGADEHDLLGLVSHLPPEFAYAAVRAPLSPPWPAPGFSWYPIEGLEDRRVEPITEAAEALLAWLDHTVTSDRVVGLLGFSQGAAVSIQAMRVAPERFAFVVNLAGYAPAGELPGDETLTARTLPVFWGRGGLDPVIPETLVDQTAQWLPWHSHLRSRVYPDVGHSLSEEELADVRAFIADAVT